jgi:hypothetical protein
MTPIVKTVLETIINILSFGIYYKVKELRSINIQEEVYKKQLLQYQMDYYKEQQELRASAELKSIFK